MKQIEWAELALSDRALMAYVADIHRTMHEPPQYFIPACERIRRSANAKVRNLMWC